MEEFNLITNLQYKVYTWMFKITTVVQSILSTFGSKRSNTCSLRCKNSHHFVFCSTRKCHPLLSIGRAHLKLVGVVRGLQIYVRRGTRSDTFIWSFSRGVLLRKLNCRMRGGLWQMRWPVVMFWGTWRAHRCCCYCSFNMSREGDARVAKWGL